MDPRAAADSDSGSACIGSNQGSRPYGPDRVSSSLGVIRSRPYGRDELVLAWGIQVQALRPRRSKSTLGAFRSRPYGPDGVSPPWGIQVRHRGRFGFGPRVREVARSQRRLPDRGKAEQSSALGVVRSRPYGPDNISPPRSIAVGVQALRPRRSKF